MGERAADERENGRLLESFSARRDPLRAVVGRVPLHRCVPFRVRVVGVDLPSGKYDCPSEEPALRVPLDAEHFDALRAVAHDDQGGRVARCDFGSVHVEVEHLPGPFSVLTLGPVTLLAAALRAWTAPR